MASHLGHTDRQIPAPDAPAWRKWLGRVLFFLAGGIVVYAWGLYQHQWPPPSFLKKPAVPYEQYLTRLEAAGLDRSALGKAWVEAGRQVLWDSLVQELPLKEAGFFPKEEARARSFVFEAYEGELVKASLEWQANGTPLVFLDLFKIGPDRFMERVAFADSGTVSLQVKIRKTGTYLLRLQPELFQSLSYVLILERAPSLAFPVEGKDSRAIHSFFGAPRDGGRRSHKGVDIFASKGTPVLAAAPGRVSRVKDGGLGGKVVWVQSAEDGAHHYYAHLNEQWVRRGQRVETGDTLGLVGNTGNARNTPSHLHFAIYLSGRGAVDPYPFLRNDKKTPDPIACPTTSLGDWQRVAGKQVPLRAAPDHTAPVLRQLKRHQPLLLLAAQGAAYRIVLPSGEQGFVAARDLEPLDGLETRDYSGGVREHPNMEAPFVAYPGPATCVEVLARDERYGLVQTPDGLRGWTAWP